MGAPIAAILDVLRLAERLKFELRHSWTSQGRRESVAEHSYQMALMAMLLHPHLEHPVDLCRTLEMVLIHDLVEAEAGDVVWFADGDAKARKAEREQTAIDHPRAFADAVVAAGEAKLAAGGIDVAALKTRLAAGSAASG